MVQGRKGGSAYLEAAGVSVSAPGYSLGQLVRCMTQLGTIGFGGPVALVGYMHRDLVEERSWRSSTVIVLGKRSITDIATVVIPAVTLLLLWKVKKIPEPAIVALAAIAGLVASPLLKA
jgi:chromate transport protein ChrA